MFYFLLIGNIYFRDTKIRVKKKKTIQRQEHNGERKKRWENEDREKNGEIWEEKEENKVNL